MLELYLEWIQILISESRVLKKSYLISFMVVLGLMSFMVVLGILLYRFNQGGIGLFTQFLLLMLVFGGLTLIGVFSYWKRFRKDYLFLAHGTAFILVMLFSISLAVELSLNADVPWTKFILGKKLVWLQCAAAILISLPSLMRRLERSPDHVDVIGYWQPEILLLYLFCSLFPVQHYIVNNPGAFPLGLAIQFALAAVILPVLCYWVFCFYLRPFLTLRQFHLLNFLAAFIILMVYMRPVLRSVSMALIRFFQFNIDELALASILVATLTLSAYRLRAHLGLFLKAFLTILLLNVAYVLISLEPSRTQLDPNAVDETITLSSRPNIYVLVADGYQNSAGLREKNLQNFDIGMELAENGFTVYENAYSNYKPSAPSMSAFFRMSHDYYTLGGDLSVLTGNNKLYSILESNGYQTAVIHNSDFLVRRACESNLCFPAPSRFEEIGFILTETIFYEEYFYKIKRMSMKDYTNRFYDFVGQTLNPFVVYSHVMSPSHGPRGCSDQQSQVVLYGEQVQNANLWLHELIEEIKSRDHQSLILVLGDHGAFLSDNCTWDNPDVTSSQTIIDNLGVLMAVKWPSDYDNRYDSKIHTLMDLSWYLLQYLSNDSLDESLKPTSSSFLKSGDNVYKVIEDGKIIDNPKAYEPIAESP